jgi:hypothetical protein
VRDIAAQVGEPTKRLRYPAAGLQLAVPERALVERSRRPGVFRATFGRWVVAGFAYRRREQLPRRRSQLEAARRRLVREVRRRDREFRLVRSRRVRVDGAPAVELLGDQTLSRARFRTRSLHVFRGAGEYVIEMLAPVRRFRGTERAVFGPLVRSLELSGRIRGPGRRKR